MVRLFLRVKTLRYPVIGRIFLLAAGEGVFGDLGLHDGLKRRAAGVDRRCFQSVKEDAGFERGDHLSLEGVEDLQDGALDGVRVLEGREGIVVGRVVELLVEEAEGKLAHGGRGAAHAIGLDVVAARGFVRSLHIANLLGDKFGDGVLGRGRGDGEGMLAPEGLLVFAHVA